MANAIYPKYKTAAYSGAANVNLTSGSVKVALVDTGVYTYSDTHEFLSDLTGVVGTAVTLTTPSVTGEKFDSDNVTFSSVTGNTVEALVLYYDTGVAGTSRLIAYLDTGQTGLPVTPNGGDITVTVDATNGWFYW